LNTPDYLATLDFIQKKYNLDINQPPPIEIPNIGRNDLAALFAELGFKVGAEIGVETGAYSEILCKANPGLKLHCVDCWKTYKGYRDHVDQQRLDALYEEAKERLAPYDCIIHRYFSNSYVNFVRDNSLDFVYIDANHEIPWVMDDICLWIKKVRDGGIISGHDYYESTWNRRTKCHVLYAVQCYTKALRVKPWFIAGTKAMPEGVTRDRSRSWFWVKREY